jgi:hypothetical protein
LKKQSLSTIAAACVFFIMMAAGCSGGVSPADKGARTAESSTIVILVENTSISLPVKQLKSDRDRFMESIHSFINNVLEGRSR